jgi:hypothetical protein
MRVLEQTEDLDLSLDLLQHVQGVDAIPVQNLDRDLVARP